MIQTCTPPFLIVTCMLLLYNTLAAHTTLCNLSKEEKYLPSEVKMEPAARFLLSAMSYIHLLPKVLEQWPRSCQVQLFTYPRLVVPNLGPPDDLGLQLLEAFTTTSIGQDFWELKSKNIWRPKLGITDLGYSQFRGKEPQDILAGSPSPIQY